MAIRFERTAVVVKSKPIIVDVKSVSTDVVVYTKPSTDVALKKLAAEINELHGLWRDAIAGDSSMRAPQASCCLMSGIGSITVSSCHGCGLTASCRSGRRRST